MAQSVKIVEVNLPGHGHRVLIGAGLLSQVGAIVREVLGDDALTAGVFGDRRVFDPYGERVAGSLGDAGYRVVKYAVAGGESNKNLETVEGLYGVMLGAGLERRSPVVAVGGGVIGDTVGFAAASYLRGVPFVQCPTTLLAMVDASVGGKVGVNLPGGKNLVGAFHQPVVVLADTDTLATLDRRELRCGLAECVKHAVIRDERLFGWIEEHVEGVLGLDPGLIAGLVERNVAIKAKVVEADEREAGERADLNFGHTFAHAIEAEQGYDGGWLHGEAVSVGMVAAARLAGSLGLCDRSLGDRIAGLLERIGLPIAGELGDAQKLIGRMGVDKKASGGRVRFVLPTGLGRVRVVGDVERGAVEQAWSAVGAN